MLALYDWRIFCLVVVTAIPQGFVVEAKYGYGVWNIHDANAEQRRRYADFHRHFHSLSDLIVAEAIPERPLFPVRHARPACITFNEEQRANEHKRTDVRAVAAVSATGLTIAVAVVSIINSVAAGALAVGSMTFVIE